MVTEEKYIGRSKLKEQPKKPFKFKLGDGSVKNQHISDNAVDTRTIENKSVTPSKRSDDFDAKVVLPYVNPVDNKYKTITDELYSMIASLQVGGIALSGKFGQRTDIGIHQKALTKAFGYLWDKIGEITGEDYMNFELSVVPAARYSESPATFTITADCSEAISDFDSIKIYVDDVLVAESSDVEVFTTSATIDETAEVRAVGVILGRTIVKTASAVKEPPFFMGSGLVYTDVINVDCLRQLDGTIEGNYDVTVNKDGDYIFIIIPISHKDEFRRADMNGYEIPVDATEMEEFVVYQSQNVYNAGTYNVDIDINS